VSFYFYLFSVSRLCAAHGAIAWKRSFRVRNSTNSPADSRKGGKIAKTRNR